MTAFRAHAALAGAALIYGANYIIAKSVMPVPVDPGSFITLRVTGACILFWLVAGRKIQLPQRQDWWRFVVCAIAGVATNQLLFFNGLALTSPLNASIIMTSNPIVVMVISALFLSQRITWLRISGVICGAAGACLLLWMSSNDVSRHSSITGDVFILVNSISWAFYLVMIKPLMRKYHPLNITAWVFLIGIVLVIPFGGTGLQAIDWHSLSTWQWFAIVYVIVATTFLTYLFNMIGVHHLSPTVASSYIYFQPVLAGLFAYLFAFFLEKDYTGDITWARVFCTLLIFLGVYLVSKSDQRNASA